MAATQSRQKGRHLCGIRTLEDLRQRCVIDRDTSCWHYRTPYGKKPTSTEQMRVWVYGGTAVVSARKVARELFTGKTFPRGWVMLDTCGEFDCINPDHINPVSRARATVHFGAAGIYRTARKRASAIAEGAKRSKLTPEVWAWVFESTQPATEIAHCVGLHHTRIAKKRSAHWATHACGFWA